LKEQLKANVQANKRDVEDKVKNQAEYVKQEKRD